LSKWDNTCHIILFKKTLCLFFHEILLSTKTCLYFRKTLLSIKSKYVA
jgi:hypothetical protein